MPLFYAFRLIYWLVRAPQPDFGSKHTREHFLGAIHRMRVAVVFLITAILIGTIGYKCIEHTTWFDAYYMSLVTLSTVGFGEVITLSHAGRVFTSFLIVFNIGFFTYAVSTLTSIFADDSLHLFLSNFRMNERIKHLRNHTIICGFGRHATEVCLELTKQKMPFVVLESDPHKIEYLRRETGYLFIEGDATEDDVLTHAGIGHATKLVTTLPEDVSNLFIVMTARQMNPQLKIISRLNSAVDEVKLRRAGADHVVIPERIGGFFMAMLLNKPDLVEFFTLISNMGPHQVLFEEIEVADLKAQFQGKSLADSELPAISELPIVAVRHQDGRYELNPPPATVIYPGMHIVILGDEEQVRKFHIAAANKRFKN